MADFDKIYGLTEDDRNGLNDFIERVNKYIFNTTNRGNFIEDDHQAPEVYIAIVPDEGILGMTQPGTSGTAAPSGEPDSAECQIYKIVPDFITSVLTLVPIGEADMTIKVYNISPSEIAGGTWITAARDKFGSWYATTGAGGDAINTGDEMRKVRPIGEYGPLTNDGLSGSGTGTGIDYDTFIYDAMIINVNYTPPFLGFVSNIERIYLLQKTTALAPEPKRLLVIDGTYLGDFLGIANLRPFHTHDFRRVYVTLAAPIVTVLKKVVTDITGITSVCNGDKTVSTTIAFTTEDIPVPKS